MAQIYKVTAHFRRVVQPASYESAEASLTVEASFDEGEYQDGNSLKLLLETKATVLKALNLAPAKADEAPTEDAGPKPVEVRKARGRPAKVEPIPDDWAPTTAVAEPVKEEPKKIPDEDLQKAANAVANKVSAQKVKEVMKDFSVARLGDLKQEDRQKFLDTLAALKKEPTKDDEIPM